MDIVIATSKRANDIDSLFKDIRAFAKEENVVVTAGVQTEGYGCTNFGLRIVGEDAEQFANKITIALQPARWSMVEGDPMLKDGEFYSTF